MVDNLRKNLTDIEQALANWNPAIAFLGIEYTYASTHAAEYLTEEQFLSYWREIISRVSCS